MVNQLLTDFHRQLTDKFVADRSTMTMSEWIVKNTKLHKRPFSFRGYEFQRKIVDDMHPNLSAKKCSQIGMALDLTTPIPTTSGWTTMGEVQVGDMLYDEQGKPCQVTYVSPIFLDHACYELTFDTGDTIVADAQHRWQIDSLKAFNDDGFHRGKGRPKLKADVRYSGVVRTEFIAQNTRAWGETRAVFSIKNAEPLETPEADLPVDPYWLGVWLGDGNTAAAVFTSHVDDVPEYCAEFERRGLTHKVSHVCDNTIQLNVDVPGRKRNHDTMAARLKQIGLIGKKFIPAMYLRAGRSQRLDVLRGLLDTDGGISPKGRVEFYNTNPQLVRDAHELITSLGFKARTRWKAPISTRMTNGTMIHGRLPLGVVHFIAYAEDDVFILERKRSRLRPQSKGKAHETGRRYIVSAEPVVSRPVRCISVDSPNHLFLAGRAMIPTHNTEVQLRKFATFLTRHQGTNGIFTLPDDTMFKRISQTRWQPMIDNSDAFQKGEEKPVRSMGITQIGSSFGYLTGNKESDATSINADILIHDEVDLSDQEMLALFQSRLQGSSFRITQQFSTPTYEGFGADGQFRISDQHEYLCRCTRCGHHNIPRWDARFIDLPGLPDHIEKLIDLTDEEIDGIDLANSAVVCEQCREPLDLDNAELREWVPRFPGRRSRGYNISPFCIQRLDPAYILDQMAKYKRRNAVRRFYNTVLGEAYNDGQTRLSEEDITAVMKTESKIDVGDAPVVMGIDMGLTCHIVLMNVGPEIPVAFRWMQVQAEVLLDEVARLFTEYRIVGGCVDRNPYTPTANALREQTKAKIIPIEYAGQPNAPVNQLIKDEFDKLTHIRSNRTAMIDLVAGDIRNRRLHIAGHGPVKQMIIDHLRDMHRVEKEDSAAIWQKLSGNDHFFHALVLAKHAIRVHDAIRYRFDEEVGSMFDMLAVTVSMSHGDDLSVRGHRSRPNALGL